MCFRLKQIITLYSLVWLCLLSLPLSAFAQDKPLQVVATTPSLGVLIREIGGEHVRVRVLSPPDRDPHYLDARPSFMAALRRADLVVAIGAGLEEGWLPAALTGAANPNLNPGRLGHFVAADALTLRPSITVDGPNLGHVHPEGNPHFHIDPLRMAQLAKPLASHLANFRPQFEGEFIEQARYVAQRLQDQAQRLAHQTIPGQHFITYHEDFDYLEEWLPVKNVGYLEPIPGVPPTARHLHQLIEMLGDKDAGVILHAVFQSAQGGEFLHRHLGWPRHSLAIEPAQTGNLDDYLALMQAWAEVFRPVTTHD